MPIGPPSELPAASPVVISPDDPLAVELAAVADWIVDASKHDGPSLYLELNQLPSGQALLAGDSERKRRVVAAALLHVRSWDQREEELRNSYEDPGDQDRLWRNLTVINRRRGEAVKVIKLLMRRNLRLTKDDLLALIDWVVSSQDISSYLYPVGSIGKAIERFARDHPIDQQLKDAIGAVAEKLRASDDKDAKKVGRSLDQLLSSVNARDGASASETFKLLAAPIPQTVGTPGVLSLLKKRLGIPVKEAGEKVVVGPDQFALPINSPLLQEHEQLSKLLAEATLRQDRREIQDYLQKNRPKPAEPKERGRLALAAIERKAHYRLKHPDASNEEFSPVKHALAWTMAMSMLIEFEFDREGLFDYLLFVSSFYDNRNQAVSLYEKYIAKVAAFAKEAPLSEGERYALSLYRSALTDNAYLGNSSSRLSAINELIGDDGIFYLVPGEQWVDALHLDLLGDPRSERSSWTALIHHVHTATSSRPSAKWLKNAKACLKAIGPKLVCKLLAGWLTLVPKGNTDFPLSHQRSELMNDENANALRGLLWCIPLLPDRDSLTRAVSAAAISAYKKVPGVGPRATKVGNAAIYCLSELGTKEAVGQLAMLKVRVKFGSAQKEIDKAFDAAAAALELPRDQIEELGVPSYGLEEVGKLTETLGDYRAELIVTGSDAALNWFDEKGKQLKSAPAKVKADHKEELKELQQSLKDIQSMLPAQRDRIDALFLAQKTWSIDDWRERYHDHPLVGTIAQRLIWLVDGAPALFVEGKPTDVAGKPIEHGKTAEIALWHPVGRPIEEIVAWRRRLEELQITQPFKQAHREVYLLTDAERNTNSYSNRYAAHVIRQHQFNALCGARRWKNKLRLCVDDYFPPATRELPLWGLRAEFWIEGLGDDFGVDTNDSGVYLRLTTDQVRFYRDGASTNMAHAGGGGYGSNATGPGTDRINEPLPLDQVPPLVFSEIMRDVDLFVGVASIGNDPTWQDGGPEGRFRDYWQGYSFGELSGTATTRKEVLERLVPRLKIANRCSFSERFLVVRGDKRTYKIHLGSGNISMEPNDQYLCIVPDAKARASQDDMYLPFEGDSVLSIIISKALLLAEDTKIKDPTITRQIESK